MESGKEIQIDVEDNRKFTILATVLDNPDTLNKLLNIRDKLKIRELFDLKDYSEHHKWPFDSSNKTFKKLISLVRELRTSLNLDPAFDLVFISAITFNRVTDDDFETASVDVFKYPYFYIRVTPFTTWPELRKVFKKFKSTITNIQEFQNYGCYFPTLTHKINDTKSEIRRDRKWYWLYKNKVPLLQIARDALERKNIDPLDFRDSVVEKAIKSYRKLIREI